MNDNQSHKNDIKYGVVVCSGWHTTRSHRLTSLNTFSSLGYKVSHRLYVCNCGSGCGVCCKTKAASVLESFMAL